MTRTREGGVGGDGDDVSQASYTHQSRPARVRRPTMPPMKLLREPLPGLLEFELTIHGDDRGSFQETFNRATLAGFGVDLDVMQDNESWSASQGTIRGLHLQTGEAAQGKLIRVTRGRVLDVALDLRPDSPTHLQHVAIELSDETPRLFWIPAGFAHGFCTLEDDTVVTYKVDAPYDPAAERTIRFDDPALGIDWPIDRADAVLSDKDAVAAPLSTYLAEVTA